MATTTAAIARKVISEPARSPHPRRAALMGRIWHGHPVAATAPGDRRILFASRSTGSHAPVKWAFPDIRRIGRVMGGAEIGGANEPRTADPDRFLADVAIERVRRNDQLRAAQDRLAVARARLTVAEAEAHLEEAQLI